MTPECLAAFESEAGRLLADLGYELGSETTVARS